MTRYQARILKELRFDARKGCGRSELCPAFSLPDLFTTKESLASRSRIEGLLDAVPPYFSQSVITPDRRAATLAFGIQLMPLERQHEVIETMQRELDPPPGVTARLAGLPVLAAEANDRIASPWRRLAILLGGLLAVGARAARRAAQPAPRARPARADRAGDRLVGARPLPRADPAEPDVDHALGARRSRSRPSSACC